MTPLTISLVAVALAAGVALATGTAAAQSLPQTGSGAAPAEAAASPASYEQQFQRARELAISGQREEAIVAYTALLTQSPGNADVLLGRGRTYAWMGRWQEAEVNLLAATHRSPTYADAWSALGDMYLWSDRPLPAVAAYGRWRELRPEDPAPLLARGRAQRFAGDLTAARADFEAAETRGADPAQVQSSFASLMPRVQNPEAFVPEGYRWSARVSAGLSQFSPARDSWYGYDVSLRRHFERGSLALEWLGAHRFRSNDYAWALDGYVGLWARAYANLRYQMSPQASLFPERSWRVEVFQGVGHGWEPSVSYDRLDFTNSSVDIYGVGLGKYVGNFYLRVLSRYVPGVGSGSLSHRGLIRYYYAGNGDDYAEINGGSGRSSSELPRRGIIRNSSTSVGIAFVKYLTPHWGFKLGADYGDDTGGFVERGVSAAVYTRW